MEDNIKRKIDIFEKETFTLKELCSVFFNLKINIYTNEIHNIILCYIFFSSGNNKYRKFLVNTRNNKGVLYINPENNKEIIFRELLQIFDFEFNKLIIRINSECENYDIKISWDDFEKKTKNISKLEFKEFVQNNSK
jgi:hypothetical protein